MRMVLPLHQKAGDKNSLKNEIEALRDDMADASKFEQIAEFFKLMGDTTRVKILYALSKKELCVQDLTIILDASTSLISHQLRQLKAARIVKQRREGKFVYYTLDDDHVNSVLDIAITHLLYEE